MNLTVSSFNSNYKETMMKTEVSYLYVLSRVYYMWFHEIWC